MTVCGLDTGLHGCQGWRTQGCRRRDLRCPPAPCMYRVGGVRGETGSLGICTAPGTDRRLGPPLFCSRWDPPACCDGARLARLLPCPVPRLLNPARRRLCHPDLPPARSPPTAVRTREPHRLLPRLPLQPGRHGSHAGESGCTCATAAVSPRRLGRRRLPAVLSCRAAPRRPPPFGAVRGQLRRPPGR